VRTNRQTGQLPGGRQPVSQHRLRQPSDRLRLYLPETWSEDTERRRQAGVPGEVVFRTKPLLAAEQIQQAVTDGVLRASALADAAYGNDTKFRQAPLKKGAGYGTGIHGGDSTDAVRMASGTGPLPPKPRKATGRSPELRQRAPHHQPVSAQDVAVGLPLTAWQTILWRNGTKKKLESRFAAVRVRPANRDFERSEPLPEQWLLIEWPPKRMAQTRGAPDAVLVGEPCGGHVLGDPGGDGQAPMDHRARLRRAETGAWPGAL
jgi:SRSO17 transposase